MAKAWCLTKMAWNLPTAHLREPNYLERNYCATSSERDGKSELEFNKLPVWEIAREVAKYCCCYSQLATLVRSNYLSLSLYQLQNKIHAHIQRFEVFLLFYQQSHSTSLTTSLNGNNNNVTFTTKTKPITTITTPATCSWLRVSIKRRHVSGSLLSVSSRWMDGYATDSTVQHFARQFILSPLWSPSLRFTLH